MEELRIACIQTDLQWEAPSVNRARLQEKMLKIEEEVDLIVLPEMFATGFTMNTMHAAESMKGDTIAWMIKMAIRLDCVIAGSLPIIDQGKFYNRLLWAMPSGQVEYYDKRHLFSFAGEDVVYTSGKEIKTTKIGDWRIGLNICYDLRFPEWSRVQENVDVLIYVANWPLPRMQAWNALLPARAIENQVYVVGVNRVGADANNLLYTGGSVVYDMNGDQLAYAADQDCIIVATLKRERITTYRERYPFLKDRDEIQLAGLP